MRSRSASTPSDTSALLDDFEWPPRADTLSVHAIDADPWSPLEADDTDATGVIFEPDAPAPAAPAPPPPPPAPRRTS